MSKMQARMGGSCVIFAVLYFFLSGIGMTCLVLLHENVGLTVESCGHDDGAQQ